jgi:octopine/nopaline transport system permease protein
MENVWQLVLKESALISVIGLVELMRQSAVGSGSTHQPFYFYATAALLYLAISSVTGWGFRRVEAHAFRGVRKA